MQEVQHRAPLTSRPFSPSKLRTAVLVLGLFSTWPNLRAQTDLASLRHRLLHQHLILRGCWSADDLNFDLTGKPLATYKAISFTESAVDITSVQLKGNALLIGGQRMGLTFNDKAEIQRVPVRSKEYEGLVRLRIEAPSGTDFRPALDAIFANSPAELLPSLPAYWRPFVAKISGADTSAASTQPNPREPSASISSPAANPLASTAPPIQGSGNMTPPVLVTQVEPQYSALARALGYSAKVTVDLDVNEAGYPTHLQISKAAGLGLDERALAAVAQYRFKPARRDDIPVKVHLDVDVTFRTY